MQIRGNAIWRLICGRTVNSGVAYRLAYYKFNMTPTGAANTATPDSTLRDIVFVACDIRNIEIDERRTCIPSAVPA